MKTKLSTNEKEFLANLTDDIVVTKKIHQAYKEYSFIRKHYMSEILKKGISPGVIRQIGLFGKYIYIYENSKGKISLIQFKFSDSDKWTWEIFSQDSLFYDVLRFPSKSSAEKHIKKILSSNIHTQFIFK